MSISKLQRGPAPKTCRHRHGNDKRYSVDRRRWSADTEGAAWTSDEDEVELRVVALGMRSGFRPVTLGITFGSGFGWFLGIAVDLN